MKYTLMLLMLLGMLVATVRAQTGGVMGGGSIVNSPHNLSAAGPGTVKATSESEICIFCHTPHHATAVQPLWNRALPTTSYKTYTSNSLKALPGQPTGSSKLCLSCHDGTIALGSVSSRQQPIQIAGGITTLPPGKTNLGTDLSDDHPISFVYDATLVTKNPKLKDPASLPSKVPLDREGNLQCTTCHEAHNNQYGNFLVMPNQNSELCNTCHTMAPTGAATDITQHTGCDNCHQTHTAPSGPYLLKQVKVLDTCLRCHNGQPDAKGVIATNMSGVMGSTHVHDTKNAVNLADQIPNNVDCKDCHESHTMREVISGAIAPGVERSLGNIDGVTIAGTTTAKAQFEYEVCLKCHGKNAATLTPLVPRQLVQPDTSMQFSPAAVSFHPVAGKGKNPNVPSLRPPYTTDSLILCTDCHGSEQSKKAGGTGPNGPHGSSYAGLLLGRYETVDFVTYTTSAYALCFNCHDNTKVVANTGPFPSHQLHIETNQTPCSACHDSHGVASVQGTAKHNAALINFDTSIVMPDSVTHQIQFTQTGVGHGTCTLLCHGKQHSGTAY